MEGYTREQYKDWDYPYVVQILFPPMNEKTGRPTFMDEIGKPTKPTQKLSREELVKTSLRLQGWPEHKIDKETERLLSDVDEMLREAGIGL